MKALVFPLVVALTLVAVSSYASGVLPVGQPEYDFIYDRAARTEALSRDFIDYQLGPYRFDRVSLYEGPFWRLHSIDGHRLETFGFATEEFRSQKDVRATGYERFRAGLAAQPHDKLFVFASYKLDEALAKDPEYTGKKWRGLAGDIDQAFIAYHTGQFDLIAGRFASFWGPRHSMVLAPNVKLDGFGYTFQWGRLSASYRLARLDGLEPDEDSVDSFVNRFLAAHRLDLHLSKGLRMGVFESVVFGGEGRSIDLFYLNPLIFFHGAQLNEGANDNTLLGFDVAYKPRTGCKLYGQILVDDFQIDNKTAADREPDQYAVILGAHLVDLPWYETDLQAEYSHVTNWTFNQMLDRNRYLFHGVPIGGALGNDYDLLSVTATKWYDTHRNVAVNFRYCRQGEGRIEAAFTRPWADGGADYAEPFPTGTVEKTTTLSLQTKGFVRQFGFLDIELGLDWITNAGHVASDTQTRPFVNVLLSAFAGGSLSVAR